MEFFDEDKAVEFIAAKLADNPTVTKKYDHDAIIEIIDMVWDYYEDNGMLDIDMSDGPDDEGADADSKSEMRDALVAYVEKMVRRDRRSPINIDDVKALVDAELAYEDSLDDF